VPAGLPQNRMLPLVPSTEDYSLWCQVRPKVWAAPRRRTDSGRAFEILDAALLAAGEDGFVALLTGSKSLTTPLRSGWRGGGGAGAGFTT
jgi:hypothetical protein